MSAPRLIAVTGVLLTAVPLALGPAACGSDLPTTSDKPTRPAPVTQPAGEGGSDEPLSAEAQAKAAWAELQAAAMDKEWRTVSTRLTAGARSQWLHTLLMRASHLGSEIQTSDPSQLRQIQLRYKKPDYNGDTNVPRHIIDPKWAADFVGEVSTWVDVTVQLHEGTKTDYSAGAALFIGELQSFEASPDKGAATAMLVYAPLIGEPLSREVSLVVDGGKWRVSRVNDQRL